MVSVVISGIMALTLTPALCALLLRPEHADDKPRFFDWFNRGFDRLQEGYLSAVGRVLLRPATFLALLRRDGGADRGAAPAGADGLHPDGGQGVLRR